MAAIASVYLRPALDLHLRATAKDDVSELTISI